MKKISFTFLFVSLLSFSFLISATMPPATPIRFDETNSGHHVFFNACTSEYVDVTYRYTQSVRGSVNGQRFTLKIFYNEQQQGIGQSSGRRYVGHLSNSYSENGSTTTDRYNFSQQIRVKMVSPGGGNNYNALSEMKYSVSTTGEVTASREEKGSDCN